MKQFKAARMQSLFLVVPFTGKVTEVGLLGVIHHFRTWCKRSPTHLGLNAKHWKEWRKVIDRQVRGEVPADSDRQDLKVYAKGVHVHLELVPMLPDGVLLVKHAQKGGRKK